MAHINPYLRFNGNCREAMNFYKSVLGGELVLQGIGDSPIADKMPAEMKDKIMHSMLTSQDIVIMASDMSMNGITKGNTVSMMLHCDSEKQVRDYYPKLSEGGKASHPLEDTFWGALFGDLTDQFGINWLLNFDKNEKR
jgi:PhnB protein